MKPVELEQLKPDQENKAENPGKNKSLELGQLKPRTRLNEVQNRGS
jgi:hypothetical protein